MQMPGNERFVLGRRGEIKIKSRKEPDTLANEGFCSGNDPTEWLLWDGWDGGTDKKGADGLGCYELGLWPNEKLALKEPDVRLSP